MIQLKKFEVSDYKRLIDWIDTEKQLLIFSGGIFNFPITYSQLDNYCNNLNRLIYKVIDKNSNTIIGHAELNNIDLKNRNARICRVIIGDKNSRNIGFGSKIVDKLVHIAFNELKLHRIDLGVYDFNKNAIKCYQKCGFKIEGLLLENTKIGNEYWSTYNMSILRKKEK